MSLPGFAASPVTLLGVTKTVYRRGEGPGVVVMPEIPGITPTVATFAGRVATAGFTVFIADLFGTPGKPVSQLYVLQQITRACVSHEFSVLAAQGESPVTNWLRALCQKVHAELGGPGIGAIGMCLTGNFALSLMVDPVVVAPVLSQPSLPFPLGAERRAGLHLSPEHLATIKQRGCPVLGVRFTHDPACPPERFAHLRAELGQCFEGIEIDSSPGNPHGLPRNAHSVLTNHLVDEAGHPTQAALRRVLSFFQERLRPEPAPAA